MSTLVTIHQLDTLLVRKLSQAIRGALYKETPTELIQLIAENDPIDLAHASYRLPASERLLIYAHLGDKGAKGTFLLHADTNTRSRLLRAIEDEELKEIIKILPADEVATIVEDMAERRFRRLLKQLSPTQGKRVQRIIQHQRHTAGRLMTDQFFSFLSGTTVGQAIAAIDHHPGIEPIDPIVVDERGIPQGLVSTRRLLISKHEYPLDSLMLPILHKVDVSTPREHVIDIVERYKLSTLLVVDKREKLVGTISAEDVIEAVEDIADATIGSMAGIQEKFDDHQPFVMRSLLRAPWLFCTLCAGLCNSKVISTFQTTHLPTFAIFFVPLVAGMSGNVGLQCSTVLVRKMALGTWEMRSSKSLEEIFIGMLTGISFGAICAIVIVLLALLGIYELSSAPLMAVVVGGGMSSACLAATALGVVSPQLFAALGVDPAVAAGPIITAINDCLSIVIYFFLAERVMSYWN